MIPLIIKLGRRLDKFANPLSTAGRKIDVVYTWVDGNDPAFRDSLARYRQTDPNSKDPMAAGSRRFQNSDELRFSLRSLEVNAPWFNRVFLVTNGQTPVWLRLDHPRLRPVTHETIFPDRGDLPTFNSAAIEMHLHRIPGLTRQFLYLNDDTFLGHSSRPGDFFSTTGKPRIFIEPWKLPGAPEVSADLALRVLAYNHRLLKTVLGERDYAYLPHVPLVYDRYKIKKVLKLWRKEFRDTSSQRFRREQTALLHVLYAHYQLAINGCEALTVGNGESLFVRFLPPLEKTLAELEEIRRTKPKFFTINDDWDEGLEIKNTVLANFLNDYFPCRSSFEK
jgi:hypothetical protein